MKTVLTDVEQRAALCVCSIDEVWENDTWTYSTTALKNRWKHAVDLLYDSRLLKETQLRKRDSKPDELDLLDRAEMAACECLFGIFCYTTGVPDEDGSISPTPRSFDKKLCDSVMEEKFGSLESPEGVLTEAADREEAAKLFSVYLSRKIWSPIPWRSFGSALKGFYERVLTPIEAPMDEEAALVSKAVLRAIMTVPGTPPRRCQTKKGGHYWKRGRPDELVDWTEVRATEFTPDGGCLEVSKAEGGKRVAIYYGNELLSFGRVVPQAIYTGGKIRVITITTARSAEYVWVNKYLGQCFRRLKCSIFGGAVDEWFKRVAKEFVCKEGEIYLSGDLESATDLFDGRLTDGLIDEFCDLAGLTERDAENMKSFTTSARLFASKTSKIWADQVRGQLMGSEISFPFLCILSLTAYILSRGSSFCTDFLSASSDGARFTWLQTHCARVGVNGDDIVFPEDTNQLGRWPEAVSRIGGRVSRGKSLSNPYFFTVNSELWCSDGQVACARPSFLTALNDGRKYFCNPAKDWLEYSSCGLIPERFLGVFSLVEKFKLDIPRSWGGLGMVKSFDPYRADWHRTISSWLRYAARGVDRCGSVAGIEHAEKLADELRVLGPKREVVVSREMAEAYSKRWKTTLAYWTTRPPRLSLEALRRARGCARVVCRSQEGKDALFREWKRLMGVGERERIVRMPECLIDVFYGRTLDGEAHERSRGPKAAMTPEEEINQGVCRPTAMLLKEYDMAKAEEERIRLRRECRTDSERRDDPAREEVTSGVCFECRTMGRSLLEKGDATDVEVLPCGIRGCLWEAIPGTTLVADGALLGVLERRGRTWTGEKWLVGGGGQKRVGGIGRCKRSYAEEPACESCLDGVCDLA